MKRSLLLLTGAFLATTMAAPAFNAPITTPPVTVPSDYGYPELVDMALAAPVTLAVTVTRATPLKGEAAVGVPPGRTRYLVESTLDGLIAGRAALPSAIRYLVDLPATRRPVKLKGQRFLLLAATGSRAGEVRLVGPRAQIARTPETEARVRGILSAIVAADAPPAITGIGHAFHVAGSLPGEGETQIFLKTGDDRPISLSILRRPGESPRWAVALSELTDASAAPPQPETLLWYRLACGLPRALPAEATAALGADDARIAAEDYATVIAGLGPCARGQKEESSTPTPAQSG